MGALHAGHLALIAKSKEENNVTVVSIFVNPIQFNNTEDFKNYPRTLDEDLALLKKLNIDYVFNPTEKDLYPKKPSTSINFGTMASVLEGKFRPGHFDGVALIVSKLLHIVAPERAYFGLKDLQQFLLIKKMCTELNFQSEIIGVNTIREESGLAMSSRNSRLSDEGRKTASCIYQGLKKIESGLLDGQNLTSLLKETREFYQQQPALKIEYLEVVNPLNLQSIISYQNLTELAICFSGYLEGIRLIDNLYLRLK